ncbi:hypothetical protein KEM54_000465 [Ascosphaera aggregata]|nr:hypothetical protein KEM54_000465 [Ascosphaera aggregata]
MLLNRAVASTGTIVDQLPRRLLNFFARYPPEIYSAKAIPKLEPPANAIIPEPAPNPYTANRAREMKERAREERARKNDPNVTVWSSSEALLRTNPEHPNPFLPWKNPETNRWRGPVVSLRRQAELVKIAAKYNVEELLPPGMKSSEYKMTKAIEKGLRVRGTGVNQRVKGHKWERTLQERLDKRKQAILHMPELIRQWKQVRMLSSRRRPSIDTDVERSVVMAVAGQSIPGNEPVLDAFPNCHNGAASFAQTVQHAFQTGFYHLFYVSLPALQTALGHEQQLLGRYKSFGIVGMTPEHQVQRFSAFLQAEMAH